MTNNPSFWTSPARAGLIFLAVLSALATDPSSSWATIQIPPPVFRSATLLADTAGQTEPRLAIAPDGKRWLITNRKRDPQTDPRAIVFGSSDSGATWSTTQSDPAGQVMATIDTDIVATRTGRVIASELDDEGISFKTSWSDDGGKSWTESLGMLPADTDRQWLAVGPNDPQTHLPRVYLLFHNLVSGSAQHNMFVQTSRDNGGSFDPPVPITVPGDQAFADLQCADSSGPASLSVNQQTGQIYAVFGTRTAQFGGGCGASVFGPFEINIVYPTRIWVATSVGGSVGSWRQSLSVDDSMSGRIVGLQLPYGAIDTAGNFYVGYPETRSAADFTADIRYVFAPPDLSSWSGPRAAVDASAGNSLVHIVAGDPGRLDFAYNAAVPRQGKEPAWFSMVAQTVNGLEAQPTFSRVRLSEVPTSAGSAKTLMGSCGQGPASGVENGFGCSRFADVYGVALDSQGFLTVAWPAIASDAVGAAPGTYVTSQLGGPSLFASGSDVRAEARSHSGILAATGGRSFPRTGILLMLSATLLALSGRWGNHGQYRGPRAGRSRFGGSTGLERGTSARCGPGSSSRIAACVNSKACRANGACTR